MGRFQPVYTDVQRAAVARAVLPAPQGDGLTLAETCRRAASGTLVEGLEPFTLPTSTAATIRRRALGHDKKETALETGPDVAAKLRRRLLTLAEAQLDRAERKNRQGKLSAAELESTARAVLKIAGEIEKHAPPNPPNRGNGNTPAGGFLEQLAHAEKR
jgi:hypothetical protein